MYKYSVETMIMFLLVDTYTVKETHNVKTIRKTQKVF
jgi:hypothetical protein